MVASLILFALFIIIYITITDVITVLFRLTGMTREKAQFQAISLLTNSGFTTHESEAVVSTHMRRQLARVTMLFGYTFTVTIVSTTVSFFASLRYSQLSQLLVLLPVWAAVLIAFYIVRKNTRFRSSFDEKIERWGNRIMFGRNVNRIVPVEYYGSMMVAQVYLKVVPPLLKDTTLMDSGIRSKHNIMVMMVKGLRLEPVQADASTVLRPHDIVMVMGTEKDIREVFEGKEK